MADRNPDNGRNREIKIRRHLPVDVRSIEDLYPAAFPDEDLLPLVRELLRDGQPVLSLVAIADRVLAGHVAFTMCGINKQPGELALMAPLAVAPDMQEQGIGSALVRDGLQRLSTENVVQVHTLGDPAYYERFGFRPEEGVAPPYPIPGEWRIAWQSIRLREGGSALRGELSLPRFWLQPALWAP